MKLKPLEWKRRNNMVYASEVAENVLAVHYKIIYSNLSNKKYKWTAYVSVDRKVYIRSCASEKEAIDIIDNKRKEVISKILNTFFEEDKDNGT